MTSRIKKRFKQLAAAGDKALVTFITAGDPDLATTAHLLPLMAEAGADIIELGIPFSDPMADGPTIQRSSERALAAGTTLEQVLQLVAAARKQTNVPIVLMGYSNPVYCYGWQRFAQDAVAAGVDGLLLVDLPPEEAGEIRAAFSAAGLALILLASPTSSQARLDGLCDAAQGYLYYVSFAGVTGASERLDSAAAGARLRLLRSRSKVPVVAGFGIKDAASAAAMAADADGVVVGSALVAAMAAADAVEAAVHSAGAFLAPLRQALDA